MRNKIFILIICLSFMKQGVSQKDTTHYKKWEIGAESNLNWLYGFYESEPDGRNRTIWLWDYHLVTSENNFSYDIYFKYKILNFIITDFRIGYKGFRAPGEGYTVNYKGTKQKMPCYSYFIHTLDFPVDVSICFFNKFPVNPYLMGGFSNDISLDEQVAVFDYPIFKFYKSRKWQYYTFRFRYGAGINFTIKKTFRAGFETLFISRPMWQTNKTMVTGLKYSSFSIGIHVGCLIK
jgi:hypothetical protein